MEGDSIRCPLASFVSVFKDKLKSVAPVGCGYRLLHRFVVWRQNGTEAVNDFRVAAILPFAKWRIIRRISI